MQIFLSTFEDVPDPRVSNARHDLCELLVIAFVSVLCGSSSCAEMAAFGRAKEHLFRWSGWRPPQTASQCAKVVALNATQRRGRRDEGYDDWGRSGKECFSGSWRPADNREAVIRLVGALMLEQNDEWAVSRRYMPVEKLTAMCDDPDAAPMIAAK